MISNYLAWRIALVQPWMMDANASIEPKKNNSFNLWNSLLKKKNKSLLSVMSFVVVVSFGFENQNCDDVVVDVVNDTVGGCQVAWVGNVVSSLQGLGMSCTSSGMVHKFMKEFLIFFVQIRIWLFPFFSVFDAEGVTWTSYIIIPQKTYQYPYDSLI